jgi:hypothetical protein
MGRVQEEIPGAGKEGDAETTGGKMNLLGVPEAKTECRKCRYLKRGWGFLDRVFDCWYFNKPQFINRLTGNERLHINEVGCMSFEEEPKENRVKVQ